MFAFRSGFERYQWISSMFVYRAHVNESSLAGCPPSPRFMGSKIKFPLAFADHIDSRWFDTINTDLIAVKWHHSVSLTDGRAHDPLAKMMSC